MRANDGVWIGWPGGTETDLEPFEDDGLSLVPISLTATEIEEFYEGFSNATLWPLYHDVVAKPEFHREWWDTLRRRQPAVRRAGRRGRREGRDGLGARLPAPAGAADAARAAARPADRVLPAHPVPAGRAVPQLPWRRQILEGLLGADLVGFQLPGGAANFVRLVRQRVGHKTHRDLVYLPDGRNVRAGRVPDLDRRRGLRGARAPRVGGSSARRRSASALGNPHEGLPRHRPARLHQGHLRPAARVQRADRRRHARRRGRGLRAGGHPVTERVEQYRDPARRHRPAGRPDQRRPRPDRPAGDQLPALVVPARGDGGALPRRRRHGRHAVTATA